MMKYGFAEDEISVRRPGEIVQRVMRILGAEPRQQNAMDVRLVVTVRVGKHLDLVAG